MGESVEEDSVTDDEAESGVSPENNEADFPEDEVDDDQDDEEDA